MDAEQKKPCRVDGCHKAGTCREVCRKHYNAFWQQVSAGETSWAELEELGLVGPYERKRISAKQIIENARARQQA